MGAEFVQAILGQGGEDDLDLRRPARLRLEDHLGEMIFNEFSINSTRCHDRPV